MKIKEKIHYKHPYHDNYRKSTKKEEKTFLK